jgi:hypothetical protein
MRGWQISKEPRWACQIHRLQEARAAVAYGLLESYPESSAKNLSETVVAIQSMSMSATVRGMLVHSTSNEETYDKKVDGVAKIKERRNFEDNIQRHFGPSHR